MASSTLRQLRLPALVTALLQPALAERSHSSSRLLPSVEDLFCSRLRWSLALVPLLMGPALAAQATLLRLPRPPLGVASCLRPTPPPQTS